MESVLKIENLKHRSILNNITFSLSPKTFNILIGSNGSGKTTLVNCIRGILDYEGKVQISGKDVIENYNEIGFFTSEEVGLEDIAFNELTNLLVNLGHDIEASKKKVYEVSKKIDASHILFKKKETLTAFEKTLIGFIFSIIHSPKTLIIDNDLEDLNEKYKNKIFEYIKKQKNMTVLFITNNSEYFYMSEKFLIINNGTITDSFTQEELLKNEKKLLKNGSNLPFTMDLSNKLISYELLNSQETDLDKMVNKIWI